MILIDGTKQIELVIYKEGQIPEDENKEEFISLLNGTIFENDADDIHQWLFNIKCAPNPDVEKPADCLDFLKEQLNIAESLLAIKSEDYIRIGCSQATLPQQAKEWLEQRLIELYKENGLDVPPITLPHNEEREKWFDSLTHQERMDYLYRCAKKDRTYGEETIIVLTKNCVPQEITKKQIKDTIKGLKDHISYLQKEQGRPKSNSKLYCAIDVFLNYMGNQKLSNSIYRTMYECLSYMGLIPEERQISLKEKAKKKYSYPIEEYMKAMCLETQEHEIHYKPYLPLV
jgi:hypothetical protein